MPGPGPDEGCRRPRPLGRGPSGGCASCGRGPGADAGTGPGVWPGSETSPPPLALSRSWTGPWEAPRTGRDSGDPGAQARSPSPFPLGRSQGSRFQTWAGSRRGAVRTRHGPLRHGGSCFLESAPQTPPRPASRVAACPACARASARLTPRGACRLCGRPPHAEPSSQALCVCVGGAAGAAGPSRVRGLRPSRSPSRWALRPGSCPQAAGRLLRPRSDQGALRALKEPKGKADE